MMNVLKQKYFTSDRVMLSAMALAVALVYVSVVLVQISMTAENPDHLVAKSQAEKIEGASPVTFAAVTLSPEVQLANLLVKVRASLPESSEADLNCLAQAIYYEARGEPLPGQIAVAEVVINRTASKRYPASICEVVFQNDHMRNRCQFSFACDGKTDTPPQNVAWQTSQSLAVYAMTDNSLQLTGTATHYHADYVSPGWSRRLEKTVSIGRHIFYRKATA
jgi:spore germination cell wall hydrolase CwlJ-like protein